LNPKEEEEKKARVPDISAKMTAIVKITLKPMPLSFLASSMYGPFVSLPSWKTLSRKEGKKERCG